MSRWNWPGRIHRAQVSHLASVLEREKIDIVYERLFHMAMITGPAVARWNGGGSTRLKTRHVSVIVSPPSLDVTRSEKRWLFWKRMLLGRSYRNAFKLLTVSDRTAQDATRFYNLPDQKIEVVPSPIDITRVDEQADAPMTCELSSRMWTSRGHARVLSIGRLSEEKGHRYLIDAVAKYNQTMRGDSSAVDLHLIGDGVCRKELEQQAHELGIAGHVFFHGHVANPFSVLETMRSIRAPLAV